MLGAATIEQVDPQLLRQETLGGNLPPRHYQVIICAFSQYAPISTSCEYGLTRWR